MRTKFAAIAGVLCLAGIAVYVGTAIGQSRPAAASASTTSKVALIDMATVFKEYEKFKILRADLEEKIKAKDDELKVIAKKAQGIQKKLEGDELAKGSPEYNDLEKQYVQLTSEIAAGRQQGQRELMREEAKNYHTIYLEVQAAVKQFADHYGYTIVMRFNREELDSTDPQKVMQGLGRQIVYHRADDDITDGVVEYINRPYKNAAKKANGSVTPAKAEQPAREAAAPKTRPSGSR